MFSSIAVERTWFAADLTPERRDYLAGVLGLPPSALGALPLIGDDRAGRCWTFPECDPAGAVVGINRRFEDGSKKVMRGGRRGLTLPAGWRDRAGLVLLTEGPTDTLALTAAGLAAVGRPSNAGGVGFLGRLLAD